jgi:hypothetical protein
LGINNATPHHSRFMSPNEERPKNVIWNIVFNVLVPSLILTKLSGEDTLGPLWSLIFALSFPIGFGGFDLIKNKKWNLFAILGLFSVLLTGGFSLMKLDGLWFAVKEASIPAAIGLFVLFTVKTKYNLVKLLIYNPTIIELDKIDKALEENSNQDKFEKLINRSTLFFVASFAVSSLLNFVLAIAILKSPAGSVEFNKELGKMTALSYPVIVVPSMAISLLALWYLFRGIKILTGLDFEEMVKNKVP